VIKKYDNYTTNLKKEIKKFENEKNIYKDKLDQNLKEKN
jgi:hypothetical protein